MFLEEWLAGPSRNALKQVDVRFVQKGDTVRVVAKQLGALPGTCSLWVSTNLYIPPGASVVLRTGTGSIAVSGEPSEVVAENQIGAIGADFKVGPTGAPKVDRASGARLEVVGGSLIVGGRNCGTVSPGDHVELRGDGRVFVNSALLGPWPLSNRVGKLGPFSQGKRDWQRDTRVTRYNRWRSETRPSSAVSLCTHECCHKRGRAGKLLFRIDYSIRRWLMGRGIWPPSYGQRALSILMVILAATGYRRWLSRPWQWSLRDYMVIVAVSSAGLLVCRSPLPMIVFFAALAGAVFACLSLARFGFKLADITMLLAIVLLTAAVILPAMERTRNRTLGKSIFRFAVPARYITLFSGSE